MQKNSYKNDEYDDFDLEKILKEKLDYARKNYPPASLKIYYEEDDYDEYEEIEESNGRYSDNDVAIRKYDMILGITSEQKEKLRIVAIENDMSLSGFIRFNFENFLNKHI